MENNSPRALPPSPDVTEIEWDSVEKNEEVEYCPETDTYRASFDSDSKSVCEAVVSTVAVISETRPTELPPLYSVIDPDALETVVESTGPGPSSSDTHVSFTFDGYTVTVHSYGIVAVRPAGANEKGFTGRGETR